MRAREPHTKARQGRGQWAAVVLSSIAGAVTFTAATTGHAQSNKVAAEVLFEEGRKLFADGKVAEACAKFADSEQLDPSSGTLLNLANCYEKQGRAASAWGTYREAASLASSAGRADHLALAQKRAAALSPALPRVTVMVTEPAEGGEVRCDGAVVPRAQWGVAVPMDPGPHACVASAPRHRSWNGTLEVPASGPASLTLTVPRLEELPADQVALSAPSADPSSAPPAGTPSAGAASSSPPHSDTGRLVVAASLGVVAVAGAVIGTVFAVNAKSKYDDSLAGCSTTNENDCSPASTAIRDDARTSGDVATVAYIVGGAALAGGLVVWLTGPSSREEGRGVALVPAPGGALLRGSW